MLCIHFPLQRSRVQRIVVKFKLLFFNEVFSKKYVSLIKGLSLSQECVNIKYTSHSPVFGRGRSLFTFFTHPRVTIKMPLLNGDARLLRGPKEGGWRGKGNISQPPFLDITFSKISKKWSTQNRGVNWEGRWAVTDTAKKFFGGNDALRTNFFLQYKTDFYFIGNFL